MNREHRPHTSPHDSLSSDLVGSKVITILCAFGIIGGIVAFLME